VRGTEYRAQSAAHRIQGSECGGAECRAQNAGLGPRGSEYGAQNAGLCEVRGVLERSPECRAPCNTRSTKIEALPKQRSPHGRRMGKE